MAAVATVKPTLPPAKMKKPSIPSVQTNVNGARTNPSASPSSATKRLPGQTQTPVQATIPSAPNGVARPSRRPQRLTTRTNTSENLAIDRRSARKYPEPYVASEAHILKKHKGRPPSLIVHLHPTHFRFDQQDGSFSYHSEMRIFIEHLAQKTIPHDMLEEFRKSEVQFYDGWLIVRVVDHKSVAKSQGGGEGSAEDDKTGSIHNYNPHITPSPYVPYPTKEQALLKSPKVKQEPGATTEDGSTKPAKRKPEPKIYHVALRPTNLSRHMDLILDAMTPDPRSLNRRQSQAYMNARTPGGGAPSTPLSAVPATPAGDKGPAAKRPKLKIDPRDMLEYEARVVNSTGPPLYLEPCSSLEEVHTLLDVLKDPHCDHEPPSPKSRKRTVAELAADDAQAREIERFMQIMDSRSGAAAPGAAAGGIEGQNAANIFQPNFEKWIVIQNLRNELADKKAREEQRRIAEDEQRKLETEARIRQRDEQARRAQEAARRQAQIQAQTNAQVHSQAQALARQAQLRVPEMPQPNGVPPNMQSQMLAASMAQRSSPIIRQSSPTTHSSPMGQQPQGVPMSATPSNPGAAGSPPRSASVLAHGHPGAPMARGPSGQGPSRNGTPQIPNVTPAVKNATPILRQGTPNSARITQASPHGSMMAPTPQMPQANMAAGLMPNGVPMNPIQRQQMQQAAMAQQAGMMPNGNPQVTHAQIAHMQAQRQAQMHAQAQMQAQAQMNHPNTPQQQHPSLSPNPHLAYQAAIRKQMGNQMANVNQNQMSPNMNANPAQHAAMMNLQQQQRQQQQMAQAQAQFQGQPSVQMPNGMQPRQAQNQLARLSQQFMQRIVNSLAQKYGGEQNIPAHEQANAKKTAFKQASDMIQRQQAANAGMMRMQNPQASPQNVAQFMAMQQQAGQAGQQHMAGAGMQMNPQHQALMQRQMMQQMHAQQQAQQQQQQQQQQQHGAGPGGGGMLNHDAQAYQQQLQTMLHANQLAMQQQQQQQQAAAAAAAQQQQK